jgi:serine/threonine protein kinase
MEDGTSDIVYIIDKMKEDNAIKYKCVEPYISNLISLLKNKEKLTKIKQKLEREEYLLLLSYLFYGYVHITKETSTIAPVLFKNDSSVKMNKWLIDLVSLGVESRQGDVYKGMFLGEKVVLKKPKNDFFLENTLKDYFNGIKCVNNLRNECPMFAYTIGILSVDIPLKKKRPQNMKSETWLVTEYIEGKTLKYMLKSNLLSFKDFLDIFTQILIALEIGQEKYKFCHYDLHTDNIIVVESLNSFKCSTFIYDIEVKSRYRPVLIDFGMSSISPEQDIFIGQHRIENNGIFPFLFPGYDAYVFLLYCIDVVGNNIVSDIKNLFKFYGDINNLDYVDTLKNNTGRQTPLLFLEFLKEVYGRQISLKFTPRTVLNKSLLFKTPSIILAELFLKPNEVKDIISSCFSFESEGFINFTLGCRRNLWLSSSRKDHAKMIAQDMLFLNKSLESCSKKEINDINCHHTINLLFLIKQLHLNQHQRYKNWITQCEKSEMFERYKFEKPFIDRLQRLK